MTTNTIFKGVTAHMTCLSMLLFKGHFFYVLLLIFYSTSAQMVVINLYHFTTCHT